MGAGVRYSGQLAPALPGAKLTPSLPGAVENRCRGPLELARARNWPGHGSSPACPSWTAAWFLRRVSRGVAPSCPEQEARPIPSHITNSIQSLT